MDDQTRSSVAAATQRYAESVAAQLGTSGAGCLGSLEDVPEQDRPTS